LVVDAGGVAGACKPPPGYACTDAVGSLKRIERAPGPVLLPAEGDVYAAACLVDCIGVANKVEKAAQGLRHAGADSTPEGAVERAHVLGNLAADRAHDLARQSRELGLEHVCQLGRQP